MRTLVLFLLIFVAQELSAQDSLTTVILLRHAEKAADGSQDPELSSEGKARAERLASVLGRTDIHKIYSTNYKRTRNTVTPLSIKKNVSVETYNPSDMNAIKQMIESNAGKTIVIVGHSNTIPALANFLIGEKRFADFKDTEYDNLLIVSFIRPGADTNVVWTTY